MMADLIARTDGPLVLLLIGLAIYMTREVLVELFDAWDDPAYCPERCRPIQLMGLFAAMLWAEGLGRSVALIRRSAQFAGADSTWVLDSWMRLGINILPATVGVLLLVWLIVPRLSPRVLFNTVGGLLALVLLFVWEEPIQAVAFQVYRIVAWLTGHPTD